MKPKKKASKLRLFRWPGRDPRETNEYGVDVVPAESEADATLVSSEREDGLHVIAVDVDLPARLVESSPGRHHLFIDKTLTWDRYVNLLDALSDAGIREDGYVEACKRQGRTYLRIHPDTPLEAPFV